MLLLMFSYQVVKLPDGKLPSLPSEGKLSCLGYEDDPRDEHGPLRASYLAKQELVI